MSWATASSPAALQALDEDILAFIESSPADSFDEQAFNALALREFEHQFACCTPYRLFCQSQHVSLDNVGHWSEIPAIPTEAYKEAVISTAPLEQAIHVYKTSGTSSQGKKPGAIYRDLAAERICRLAQLRAHKEYMLPDRSDIVFLSLSPSPESMPSAGVAYCMDMLMRCHGAPGSRRFFTPTGVDMDGLVGALRESENQGTAVGIYAATFGFVHIFDWCEERGIRFQLPPGSRMNHGSGYKGRSRELTKQEFLEKAFTVLGISPEYDVDVLGMTEVGSQFYDNVLRNRIRGVDEPRYKAMLPWARTRVLDPVTLEPVPPGERGVLVHYDLALRGNVFAVQTADVGVPLGDGFEILGRIEGAEARGCNLSIEDMLASPET